MCGRYTLKTSGADLKRELGLLTEPGLSARYNIAPTQLAPIVTQAQPQELTQAHWGLLPRHVINARVETVGTHPLFRGLLGQRCLVPADGFYEWARSGGDKVPHYFSSPAGLLTFAGLYSTYEAEGGRRPGAFTVLTCAASDDVVSVHDRMPLVLSGPARAAWLAPGPLSAEAIAALAADLAPPTLAHYQVERWVNSARVDEPRCLAPASNVQLSLFGV